MRFRLASMTLGALLTMAAPTVAHAQDPIEQLELQANAVYTKYKGALAVLLESAGSMNSARNLKADSLPARLALIAQLKAGATKIDPKLLESAQKAADSDAVALAAAQTDSVVAMTAEQKQMMVAGLKQYLVGVGATLDLGGEVANLGPVVTAAALSNPLKLRKVKDSMSAAKDMAKGIPGLIKQHGAVIVAMKDYVVKNKLPMQTSDFTFGKK